MNDRWKNLPFEGSYELVSRPWREVMRPEPAVYRLRAWCPETSAFRPIPRCAATDLDGILDLGESGNGLRRIDELCHAIEGKPRSHRAGREFSVHGYDFGAVFAPANLRLEFMHLPSKELAEALELALIEDYRWRFKDRPPLNSSSGKWSKVCRWLESQGRAPRDQHGWIDLSGLLPKSRRRAR